MQFNDYKHAEMEPQIQQFWEKQKVVAKLKKKNEKGKKFYFLQGPPYTSGRAHLGTAWNTCLKDTILRYKRSQGFNAWDRNGYDVHGLPTEHKVMAKYKLDTKEDIEKFGVGKFIKECIKFSIEMGAAMTTDFLRLGSTLDYNDSYMALKNDYMEGEWWMIKQAEKKDRLYLGEKVMTWCAGCETALAKHECEYEELSEDSIFLKFQLKGKKNEFLVIWTTTPWTIPFNLGIMVNPELDYLKVEVEGEKYILGKSLAGPLVQSVLNKKMKVLEEFKGGDLEGLEYVHPWEKIIPQFKELKQKHPKVHTVVLSEQFVDFTAGSGLVHMAPGCGPEDFEVGRDNGIPPFNTLNEKGEFQNITTFNGRIAKKDDPKFIADLDKSNALLAVTKVEHDYPHCWRCHHPVVFRLTKQWFFKIEDLKVEMVKENKKVNWTPQTNAFDAWTNNLRDNSITRQRYWGTPVPIWKCNNDNCENVEVIGSIKELQQKAGKDKVPDDIHRPWIDKVEWNCKKCKKGKMHRIEDILDVWIDAGTASWNCLYYPQKEKNLADYFPADFILEATEQVRLWFSMLSICSQLAFGKNCYKNVYMHGMLNDIDGKKMSKSLGNIISPYEIIDKHGADVLRYYMCQTNAGQDVNFSWEECALKARHLHILWNIHKLLINLSKENKINPFKLDNARIHRVMDVEEKYIISKLHSTIETVTNLFDSYQLDCTILPLEELFLELSRTYIQMVRDKSALGSDEEKEKVIFTIAHVLMELLKMFNIIAPFISEAIYQNLKEEFALKEASIIHFAFPKADKKKVNPALEEEMEIAQNIIQSALNAREKAKLGLRWPLKELIIISKNEEIKATLKNFEEIIKNQLNVKKLLLQNELKGVTLKVKPDYGKIGWIYQNKSAEIIVKLTADSPQTILGHLEKENVYRFKLNEQEINITREMIEVERDVPEDYQEAEFKSGQVYLNLERNEELEAEGFAREIMRHVQILRKNAKLEKLDEIELYIQTTEHLHKQLDKFKDDIAEKVGADKLEISTLATKKKFVHHQEIKIKNEKFVLGLNKI